MRFLAVFSVLFSLGCFALAQLNGTYYIRSNSSLPAGRFFIETLSFAPKGVFTSSNPSYIQKEWSIQPQENGTYRLQNSGWPAVTSRTLLGSKLYVSPFPSSANATKWAITPVIREGSTVQFYTITNTDGQGWVTGDAGTANDIRTTVSLSALSTPPEDTQVWEIVDIRNSPDEE